MGTFVERLLQAGAQVVLEALVGAVLTVGAALLARNLARRGRVWVGHGAGRTCMSPYVLLVAVLCGGAAAAFLVLGLIEPESLREPGSFYAWAGLVGGFTLLFAAIVPFTRHTWEWDAAGLRWHGAFRSVSIPWSELARVGKAWHGQFFAADRTGRRFYWSTYTLEHAALRGAIQAARPDLALP
jgi:hypothetical protein